MSPRNTSNVTFLNARKRPTYLTPCWCGSNKEHLTMATNNILTTLSYPSCSGMLLANIISFIFTSRRTDRVRIAMKAQPSFWSFGLCLFGSFQMWCPFICLLLTPNLPISQLTVPTPLHYHQFPTTTSLERNCSLPPRLNIVCIIVFTILIMFHSERS